MTYELQKLKRKVDALACKVCNLPSGGGSGSGSGYSGIVNTYNDLPDPSTVSGQFWYVINNQGTWWLPGSLGGTYYPKGSYYSDGSSWTTVSTPWQASQPEVDAGIVPDKFVTPLTLNNYSKWSTKSDVGHTHNYNTLSNLPPLDGGLQGQTLIKDSNSDYDFSWQFISGSDLNIDGGTASSVYLITQLVDGGGA